MSARPGRFLDIIATAWPRERDSTIVSSESFGRLTSRIWTLLRGESIRALGRA
jgi:NitT/TauT family transport system ATP-binding protein